MDEKILVVDRKYLFHNERLTFQGFMPNEDEFFKKVMGRFNSFFEVKRGYAEVTESLKQPISYILVKRGDEIFITKRLVGSGEERLHGSISIGVGGHMNLLDDNCRWSTNLKLNIMKELNEELQIDYTDNRIQEPQVIGILNDDTTDVGRYHIGIISVLDLPYDAMVSVKETDKLEGAWVKMDLVHETSIYEHLESWSRHMVRYM